MTALREVWGEKGGGDGEGHVEVKEKKKISHDMPETCTSNKYLPRVSPYDLLCVSPYDIPFLPSDPDTPANVRLIDSPLLGVCPCWSSVCCLYLTGVQGWRFEERRENPGFYLSL